MNIYLGNNEIYCILRHAAYSLFIFHVISCMPLVCLFVLMIRFTNHTRNVNTHQAGYRLSMLIKLYRNFYEGVSTFTFPRLNAWLRR